GRPVPQRQEAPPEIVTISHGGSQVAVLKQGLHYTVSEATEIVGEIAQLCRVANNQRIVLSHDLSRTYIVVAKERSSSQEIRVSLRKARIISDPTIFEET